MVRGRGSRGFVPQDIGQRGGSSSRGRGRGRGTRGGPPQSVRRPDLLEATMEQYDEFDFNDFNAQHFTPTPGFVPRGRGNNRGRGLRGGGPTPQQNLRRQDLVDEIMNQVEELDDDDFNFGISFKPLSSDSPSRGSRGRGDWRGRDSPARGGRGGRGRGGAGPSYAYAEDYVVGGAGPRRGSAPRMRGSGLGFASPPTGSTPVKSVPGAVIDPATLPDYGRPLLRPVIFVRALMHKTLFQEVDEVIQAHDIKLPDVDSDDTEDPLARSTHSLHDPALSHAPTADRVAAVFGIQDPDTSVDTSAGLSTSDDEAEDDSELQLPSTPKPAPTQLASQPVPTTTAIEETTTIEVKEMEKLKITKSPPAPVNGVGAPAAEEAVLFVIDTAPSTSTEAREQIIVDNTSHLQPLGDDDEIILYNPPARALKSKPGTPAPPSAPPPVAQPVVIAETESTTIVASTSSAGSTTTVAPMQFDDFSFATSAGQATQPSTTPTPTPGKLAQLKRRVNQRKAQRKRGHSFGMMGALLEEARTRQEAIDRLEEKATTKKTGPLSKKAKRGLVDTRGRSGGRDADSDLDWGTDDGEDDGADENVFTSAGTNNGKGKAREEGPDASLASMDVDPDLVELEDGVYAKFVKGLSRSADGGGGQYTTIDDLEDAAKLQAEDEDDSAPSQEENDDDEEDENSDQPEEEEAYLEATMGDEESDEVSSDEDDDLDEVGSFDARLKKIRARQKKHADAEDSSEDDDSDGPTKAKQDEAFLAQIKKMIDENSTILEGGGKRKKGKPTFDEVLNGDFELDESEEQYFPERIRRKNKGKTFVDAQMQELWERDRLKKADQKRKREELRREAQAAALSPRMAKQLGKRLTKDNRNKGPATGELLARGGVPTDFTVIEAEIRAFVRDLRRESMALPPLDKPSRARIHLIAQSFGMKSKSTGKGEARFITLIRTSRTRETGVNESKVRRLVHGGPLKGSRAPRHKEGDEVGKAAPKLTDENLGYRLLQQMGWTEGDRIGLSTQGLEAPISAFIKTTKLGLGASFAR